MKYVLIDGNNLAIRCSFANAELMNSQGVPTGVHYGVFKSLLKIQDDFPNAQLLIAWDGKSKRRTLEANEGVKNGLVPSGYKENRPKGADKPAPLLSFESQSDYLKKAIDKLGIPQIRMPDYEADDIIAAYCHKLTGEHETVDNSIVIITSDRDYYQLLSNNVVIFDAMKNMTISKALWEKENGLGIDHVISVGAFSGDASDNIFGVPGWGDNTAIKALQKHGSIKAVYEDMEAQVKKAREDYPDDISDEDFKELSEAKTQKGTSVWPQVTRNLPYLGVALACHRGKIKLQKRTVMALIFKDRIRLAYSLKRMDKKIPNLPDVPSLQKDLDKLEEYCDYYEMPSLWAVIKQEEGVATLYT